MKTHKSVLRNRRKEFLFRNSEFMDLSNILSEGFFADRVVSILRKQGALDSAGEEVLVRVQSFLERIHKGQEEVGSERLSSDAIGSIDAYQRAIVVLHQALAKKSEEITKDKFTVLIAKMTDEITNTLENRCIIPEKVTTTLEFFRFVRRETLKEGSEFFSGRAVLTWPKRTYSYPILFRP